MIYRNLTKKLIALSKQFPVVAILGPRQSGKTTLAQLTFKKHNYVLLEETEERRFAQSDPKSFLEDNVGNGVILDEFQHVLDLLSYIQGHVDKHKKPGQFILTGSQNFLMNQAISKTLAGRIAILTLLPFSISELQEKPKVSNDFRSAMFTGFYPQIITKQSSVEDWYPNYIETCVEKDIRQIKNVGDLGVFKLFIKMCAGRTGQLLNISSLGDDCGITANTAKSWLSLLEQSYIIFLLRPHYKNFGKRLVKSPKLYFYDSGLACSLLEIKSAQQLRTHYLRGNLFEGFIISEIAKQYYNRGIRPPLYFWRDGYGHEIDCIIEKADKLIPIEIKSGKTINADFFKGTTYWNEISKTDPANNLIIYAGDASQKRKLGRVVGWQKITNVFKKIIK